MPDVREVFDLVTQKAGPEPGALQRQDTRQRKHERNQKVAVIGLVAAVVVVGAAVLLNSRFGGNTEPANPSPTPSLPMTTLPVGSLFEQNQEIFVRQADGTAIALTHGFLPVWSPDHSTVAFLRDPLAPHHRKGDPFVLQAWLIHPDGSGLTKIGHELGCCVGVSADLSWSPDGRSIVLTGIRSQTINVARG